MISTKIIRFTNTTKYTTFDAVTKRAQTGEKMMKTIRQIRNALLVSLLLATSVLQAQVTTSGNSVTASNSFAVGMYMGPQWKINLLLDFDRPERIVITLKDAANTVLYEERIKRPPTSYWRKFDFEQSEPGIYQFEISDGRQTVIRRVEIVAMPTVEAQRYITYGPQTNL